jgi:large subunit ribosomal protein L5
MARLQDRYREEIVPQIMERFSIENIMAVPRIDKISVNMGVGAATENRRRLDTAMADLGTITGQRPAITRARGSHSGFKVREGNAIGCRVTLRGARMYEFLDRLISIAIPRIRDFRGLPSKSFDGRGNYSMGLSEQIVFPEINIDKVEFPQGMNITITIRNSTDEQSFELLRLFGMPFKRD